MNPDKPPPPDMQAQFRQQFVTPTTGRVLVVGSALYPTRPNWREWHPNGKGVDMLPGVGVDYVVNLEHDRIHETFEHIECLSVLEHSKRPWLLAANIEAMLSKGGSLFVAAPWVWKFHGYPHDYWRFSHLTLPILFPSIVWKDVRYRCGDALTESERMPRNEDGFLTKMEIFGWGLKS
jgi:hypothetical protein